MKSWTSLVVQWLRLRASTAEGMGSIPGQGSSASRGEAKRKKKYEVVFCKFNANCIVLDSMSLNIIEVLSLSRGHARYPGSPRPPSRPHGQTGVSSPERDLSCLWPLFSALVPGAVRPGWALRVLRRPLAGGVPNLKTETENVLLSPLQVSLMKSDCWRIGSWEIFRI